MDLLYAIKNRRSIRKYKDTPVDDKILKDIFEYVRYAPSWGNTQCWQFIVIRDKETKEKLKETLPPYNPAYNAITDAPVVIVACGDRKSKSGYYRGITYKGDWVMFDVALALSNLTLVAYYYGLGTVHIGAFDADKVAKILSIPENIQVIELIPIGYPDETPEMPKRKDVSEFVFYESYGRKC